MNEALQKNIKNDLDTYLSRFKTNEVKTIMYITNNDLVEYSEDNSEYSEYVDKHIYVKDKNALNDTILFLKVCSYLKEKHTKYYFRTIERHSSTIEHYDRKDIIFEFKDINNIVRNSIYKWERDQFDAILCKNLKDAYRAIGQTVLLLQYTKNKTFVITPAKIQINTAEKPIRISGKELKLEFNKNDLDLTKEIIGWNHSKIKLFPFTEEGINEIVDILEKDFFKLIC